MAKSKAGEPSSSPGEVRRPLDNGNGQGIVIAAFVRARLLGLQILTVDARVALVPAETAEELPSVAGQSDGVALLAHEPLKSSTGKQADLAYAVRLLEDSSKSLDEVRGDFRRKT